MFLALIFQKRVQKDILQSLMRYSLGVTKKYTIQNKIVTITLNNSSITSL